MMPDVRPLSPELQEIAKKELGEEPERLEKDLQHIKDWLKKQPHLHARTDDQFLVAFLRGCKFSLERTKEKLDNYYTMRTALPELFGNRDPMDPDMQKVFSAGGYLPLPELDDQGRRVIVQRNIVDDPEKWDIIKVFQSMYYFMDFMMREDDHGTVKGYVIFMDMKGMTINHILRMPMSLMKKSTTCFQEAYPFRVKALHYFNIPSFFEKVFNFFAPWMKEKLLRRVHVHADNMEEVYKDIPKRILPKEYGGDGPTMQELTDHWKKKVESYRKYFLEDSKYCCNEKKRPGKPKTSEDLFGLEGSFRQLTFD